MMAGVAVLRALDADGDGRISTSEIDNAAAALKKLDKNSDGQLTRDELEIAHSRISRARAGRGPRGRGGAAGRGAMLERLRQFDQNGDGKFSKDELPPRLQERFDALDTNKDGFLNPRELPAGQRRGGRWIRTWRQSETPQFARQFANQPTRPRWPGQRQQLM